MPVTTTHRRIKTTLRTALADTTLFDDAHLVVMLDMARAKQMQYTDICRCFAGLSNVGYYERALEVGHYDILSDAEKAFEDLGWHDAGDEHGYPPGTDWNVITDARRNRRIISLILREIRTRSRQPTGRTAQLSMAPSMAPATKFQMVD